MKIRKPLLGLMALTLVTATSVHAAEAIDPERTYSRTYRTCLETGDAPRA